MSFDLDMQWDLEDIGALSPAPPAPPQPMVLAYQDDSSFNILDLEIVNSLVDKPNQQRRKLREKQRRQNVNEKFSILAQQLNMNPRRERLEVLENAITAVSTLKDESDRLRKKVAFLEAQIMHASLYNGSLKRKSSECTDCQPICKRMPLLAPKQTGQVPCSILPPLAAFAAMIHEEDSRAMDEEMTHSHCA